MIKVVYHRGQVVFFIFNLVDVAFLWRADDGPTLNACLEALRFLGDPDQHC